MGGPWLVARSGVSLGLPPPLSLRHMRPLTACGVTEKRPPIISMYDTEDRRDAGSTLSADHHGPKSGVHRIRRPGFKSIAESGLRLQATGIAAKYSARGGTCDVGTGAAIQDTC